MAHVERTRVLISELIRALGVSPGQSSSLENRILQTFAADHSARTNQFEIKARLEGLVEKSRILNRDALADALDSRIGEVHARQDEWTPEIVSLLLHLSQRPVEANLVKDLARSKPEPIGTESEFEDIFEHDLSEADGAIWRDVDFGPCGSDSDSSEAASIEAGEAAATLKGSSSEIDETDFELGHLIVEIDAETLAEVQQIEKRNAIANKTNDAGDSLATTELVLIRQVIFMLLGLPTSISSPDEGVTTKTASIIALEGVSAEASEALLLSFTTIGDELLLIRNTIRSTWETSVEQTFQFVLENRLWSVDIFLHNYQTKFLSQATSGYTSLLHLQGSLNKQYRLLRLLTSVCKCIKAVDDEQSPFEILQLLYLQTCEIQTNGDPQAYEYLATAFLECFQVYLGPIREWMEDGVITGDPQVLLTTRSEGDAPLHSIWHEQFSIKRNLNGDVNAPSFLHIIVKRILNTGKAIHFLRRLGYKEKPPAVPEPNLTFESICRSIDPYHLSPFPELFDAAFSRWILSKHSSWSSVLKYHLDKHCGLDSTLDAMEFTYLYRSSYNTTSFVYPLFSRLDDSDQNLSPRPRPSPDLPWANLHLVNSLLRDSFASITSLDGSCLQIQSHTPPSSEVNRRSMSTMTNLRPSYAISWPIRNIIRPVTQRIYNKIFTLLTQLHRGIYLLTQSTNIRTHSNNDFHTTSKSPVQTLFLRLRHHLHTLLAVLLSHFSTLVLPSLTHRMRTMLHRAEDLDAMCEIHSAYTLQIEDMCLLSERHSRLHKTLLSILDAAIILTDLAKVDGRPGNSSHEMRSARRHEVAESEEYEQIDHKENRQPSRTQAGGDTDEHENKSADTDTDQVTYHIDGVTHTDRDPKSNLTTSTTTAPIAITASHPPSSKTYDKLKALERTYLQLLAIFVVGIEGVSQQQEASLSFLQSPSLYNTAKTTTSASKSTTASNHDEIYGHDEGPKGGGQGDSKIGLSNHMHMDTRHSAPSSGRDRDDGIFWEILASRLSALQHYHHH